MEPVASDSPISMTKHTNYFLLKLSGNLKDATAEDYLKQNFPEMIESGFDVIVNCTNITNISRGWLRALSATEKQVRENKKGLRLIRVPNSIQLTILNEGLSRILKSSNDLRDALLSLGLVTKLSLDVGFINPFLSATLNVLKVLVAVEARAGSIFMKKSPELTGDISGVIGLISDSFNGNVTITFPEKTFVAFMSKIHGEVYTSILPEIADGAGEISNMIFGQAKIELNEQGYAIKTALPSIILGKNHHFSSGAQGLTIVVPFESPAGNFFVEICILDNAAVEAA